MLFWCFRQKVVLRFGRDKNVSFCHVS